MATKNQFEPLGERKEEDITPDVDTKADRGGRSEKMQDKIIVHSLLNLAH